MATVLVVDDEGEIRASLRGVLSDEGLRVLEAEDGRQALDLVRSERPELVLLDVWMPEVDGIELLRSLQDEPDRPQVIMISGHGNIETAVQATKLGAFDFIEKPFSIDALLRVVNRALEHRALHGAGGAGAGAARRARRAARQRPRGAAPPCPSARIGKSVVASGHGLHTGVKSGLILNPLPPGRGIVFTSLSTAAIGAGASRLRRLDRLRDDAAPQRHDGRRRSSTCSRRCTPTASPTCSSRCRAKCRPWTARRWSSASSLEQAGVEDQGGERRARSSSSEPLRRRRRRPNDESIAIEPADGFSISYTLVYPPPVGRQEYTYVHRGGESFRDEIAPARTFGFVQGHEGDGGDGPGQRRPARQLHPRSTTRRS